MRKFLAVCLVFLAIPFLGQSAPHPSVTLTWVASVDSGVSYNVYRSQVSGGPYTIVNTAPVTVLTFTDLSVSVGQKYFYVATATLNGTESKFSNEVSAVILPASPTLNPAVVQ